jgi:hypothetical protein
MKIRRTAGRFSTHLKAIKCGSDLSGSKRKTHVTRVSSGDGVHGKTTCLVGSGSKGSLGVNIDSSTFERR